MSAVVIGAGIGGLATALKLAPMPVTVLSAAPLGHGIASAWAQGGIAAAIGSDDSPAQHAADTLAVGGGLVDPATAAMVAAAAPGCIAELEALGARFDRGLGREGGHSRNRIVHAQGDATGAEIMRVLTAAAQAAAHITVLEATVAERLLLVDGSVAGVLARCGTDAVAVRADAVVLATGGVGGLFARTSNPVSARGRGLALAARAGAALADLEFVQFHPTALDVGVDPMPLVTEALRGAGATLLDEKGERFMCGEHPLAELAPRDVVARAVWRRGRAFLDARDAVGAAFPQRFPTVYAACRRAGLDPVRQPIPIATAAHYHMGGVWVDADGRSTLDGLWAVGEAASTGLHGANRLASNSLLEALVFAARVAEDIHGRGPLQPRRFPSIQVPRPTAEAGRLRQVMMQAVGLEREARGLAAAIEELRRMPGDAALVGVMIASAALRRRESRGAQYRSDFPGTDPAGARRQIVTLAEIAPEMQEIES